MLIKHIQSVLKAVGRVDTKAKYILLSCKSLIIHSFYFVLDLSTAHLNDISEAVSFDHPRIVF